MTGEQCGYIVEWHPLPASGVTAAIRDGERSECIYGVTLFMRFGCNSNWLRWRKRRSIAKLGIVTTLLFGNTH